MVKLGEEIIVEMLHYTGKIYCYPELQI